MATKSKGAKKARRRVYVKAHKRRRPVARWQRELAKSREMPF